MSKLHWAGEGSCVANRLPGIFGHSWSVPCQEGHSPAGTACRLHRKGWVADVSSLRHWSLSVGSRSQAGCTFQGVPSQHSGDHQGGASEQHCARISEWQIWWLKTLRHPEEQYWGCAAVLVGPPPCPEPRGVYIHSMREQRRYGYQSHLFFIMPATVKTLDVYKWQEKLCFHFLGTPIGPGSRTLHCVSCTSLKCSLLFWNCPWFFLSS